MALRTPARLLVTPVEVSVWTTRTALMRWFLSRLRRSSIASAGTPAVLGFQSLYVDAVGGGGATKQVAEVSVYAAQHLVARRKRVDNTAFPSARAGAGEEENMTLGGPKDRLEPLQNFAQKGCEYRSPMIDQGLGHGPSNALWHDARAWYLKKGPAGHKMRERYLIFPGYVKGVGLSFNVGSSKAISLSAEAGHRSFQT